MKFELSMNATSGLNFACLRRMVPSWLTLNRVISLSFLLLEVSTFTALLHFYPSVSIFLMFYLRGNLDIIMHLMIIDRINAKNFTEDIYRITLQIRI